MSNSAKKITDFDIATSIADLDRFLIVASGNVKTVSRSSTGFVNTAQLSNTLLSYATLSNGVFTANVSMPANTTLSFGNHASLAVNSNNDIVLNANDKISFTYGTTGSGIAFSYPNANVNQVIVQPLANITSFNDGTGQETFRIITDVGHGNPGVVFNGSGLANSGLPGITLNDAQLQFTHSGNTGNYSFIGQNNTTFSIQTKTTTDLKIVVPSGNTELDTNNLKIVSPNTVITGDVYVQGVLHTGQVGEIKFSEVVPTSGTWLETGKYYSTATYPALATALGSIPDVGNPVKIPLSNFPINDQFYLSAASNTIAVAVNFNGNIITSTDGINWKYTSNPVFGSITQIRYLNGNFIVVGGNTISSIIATSPDGINWTQSYVNYNSVIRDIAYYNSKYVAVGSNGLIIYSTDLINWTQSSYFVQINTYNSIQVINNLFFISTNNNIFSSTDGNIWTTIVIPQTSNAGSISYGGGYYVVVNGSIAVYSSNLTTWTLSTGFNTTATLISLLYSGNKFIAVINDGSVSNNYGSGQIKIYYSTNGLSWSQSTISTSSSISNILMDSASSSLYFNGTKFFLGVYSATTYSGGGGTGQYLTSSDGINWTLNKDGSLTNFYSFVTLLGITTGFGYPASVILDGSTRNVIAENGSWKFVPNKNTVYMSTLAYGSNTFITTTGYEALISTDAFEWKSIPGLSIGGGDILNSCYYLNGNLFIVGQEGFLSSSNGSIWKASTPLNLSLSSPTMTYGNSVYVLLGRSNNIYSSSDANTWVSHAVSNVYNTMCFGNNLFVAVGNSGLITTSPDGATWTSRTSGTSNNLYKTTYINNLYFSVGGTSTGCMTTSPDGATWTVRTVPGANALNSYISDIVWGGSQYITVGSGGLIASSPDANTWTQQLFIDNSIDWKHAGYFSNTFFITGKANTHGGNIVMWKSTDAVTWNRVDVSAPTGNVVVNELFNLGGKYILPISGNILSSTDANTWTSSNNSLNFFEGNVKDFRLYNSGGKYFATYDALYISPDGITYNIAPKNVPYVGCAAVAYNGTFWLAAFDDGDNALTSIYKSLDTITWTKLSNLGGLLTTGDKKNNSNLLDFVYANNKFILGYSNGVYNSLGSNSFINNSLTNPIQTSLDGITWAGSYTPNNAKLSFGTNMQSAFITDGNTVIIQTSGIQNAANPVIASTDGGVTWNTILSNAGSNTGAYANGLFVLGNYSTTDLINFNSISSDFIAKNLYVSGKYAINIGNGIKTFFSTNGNGSLTRPMNAGNYFANNFGGRTVVTRGNTFLIPAASFNTGFPNNIAEFPLFSYNTNTTFYVPPNSSEVRQKSYIYAGP